MYPIMCMAYSIPADTLVNMVLDIAGGVGNRSVAMTMPATDNPIAKWSLSTCIAILLVWCFFIFIVTFPTCCTLRV